VEEYKGHRFARALELLPSDGAAHTAVADVSVLYRAKSNLALEKLEEALNEFRRLQREYPSSPQLTEAILGESQTLLRLKQPKTALAVLRNPSLPLNSETLYARARAHEEDGNTREALELLSRVLNDFPTSDAASLAFDRFKNLAQTSITRTPGFLLQRAENLLRSRKNREARTLLLTMKMNLLPADREKRALLLGEAEFNLGRVTVSVSHLKKVTGLDPSSHARALYLLGAAYRRLKQEGSYLEIQDTMMRLYPESPFAERLLFSLATFFELDQQPTRARDAYRLLAARFPRGEHGQRARWKVPIYYYAEGNYAEALHGFWQYLLAFPEPGSASAPIFWMARCYEKLGDSPRAVYLYGRASALANDSYYGRRSDEALAAFGRGGSSLTSYEGLDFQEITRFLNALSLPQPAIPEPTSVVAHSIERARQLVVADLPDLALVELRAMERRYPSEKALSFVSARIYERKEDFFGVIATLRRAFPDYSDLPANSFPEEVWQLLFPVRHSDIISAQAKKHNIDPALILGLIRQESAFRLNARSPANARGLMQVLPSTGRRLARNAGVPRYTVQKLFQAETNITLGARHLVSLLQRFDNKVELALAAYNAGQSRVDQWLKNFGNVEMTEFVERIPFAETRVYVKQVLTNEAHYRRLAASASATPH
jgi:soluble lytic murein transglycosylase